MQSIIRWTFAIFLLSMPFALSLAQKSADPDHFVIPAGTEIKVRTDTGEVSSPVRVGKAVAIYSGETVTLKPGRVCHLIGTYDAGVYDGITNTGTLCEDGLQISSITVAGKTYSVETAAALAERIGFFGEQATFTLSKPLAIAF